LAGGAEALSSEDFIPAEGGGPVVGVDEEGAVVGVAVVVVVARGEGALSQSKQSRFRRGRKV